jgi:DNA polymerase III epsilon subunit-like protein
MSSVTVLPKWAAEQFEEFQTLLKRQVNVVDELFATQGAHAKAPLLEQALRIHQDLESRARRFGMFLKATGTSEDRKMLEEERQELVSHGMQVDWLKPADVLNVLFVDTETTGLTNADQPISIGLILVEVSSTTGFCIRELGCYHGLREPSCPINPKAAQIHGLTSELLSNRDFDYAAVVTFFGVADLIVAHNAEFDRRMLKFIKFDRSIWACSCWDIEWPHQLQNRKLDTICSHFGIRREFPHNALTDARAVFEISQSVRDNDRTYLADLIAKKLRPDSKNLQTSE